MKLVPIVAHLHCAAVYEAAMASGDAVLHFSSHDSEKLPVIPIQTTSLKMCDVNNWLAICAN